MKAIIEDPFRVFGLIDMLHEHPLWICYVHPIVVAGLVKMSYPSGNVAALIKR